MDITRNVSAVIISYAYQIAKTVGWISQELSVLWLYHIQFRYQWQLDDNNKCQYWDYVIHISGINNSWMDNIGSVSAVIISYIYIAKHKLVRLFGEVWTVNQYGFCNITVPGDFCWWNLPFPQHSILLGGTQVTQHQHLFMSKTNAKGLPGKQGRRSWINRGSEIRKGIHFVFIGSSGWLLFLYFFVYRITKLILF